jgi:hypothetical protein
MAMYHPKHPDGNYVMHNRVELFDPPHTIAWQPGYDAGNGSLGFGGWIWRYDLTADDLTADDLTADDLTAPRPSHTTVTLSYDWSAVPDPLRDRIGFPPFPPEHLDNSLAHLAQLLER